MRPQEIKDSFRRISAWRFVVVSSLVAMTLVLFIELIYHPVGRMHQILGFIEIAGISVIFIDLAVNFSRTDNKNLFLRQNWFELTLFIPFLFAFELFRMYAIFEAAGIQAMPFMMRTKLLMKGGHVLTHVSRSEPARVARMTCFGVMHAPDRYRGMKYRGLLSF
ncbi:MAG: hypothetical protein ABIG39_05095 [Candidatus Micrarchaeota archaeon]